MFLQYENNFDYDTVDGSDSEASTAVTTSKESKVGQEPILHLQPQISPGTEDSRNRVVCLIIMYFNNPYVLLNYYPINKVTAVIMNTPPF